MTTKNSTIMLSKIHPNLSVDDKKGKVTKESKRYYWVTFAKNQVVRVKRAH